MIISTKGNFIFFSSTKSASTAIERALAPFADVTMSNPPELKHIGVRGYERHFASALANYNVGQLERVAVIRHPIDWLSSWYRYRSRADLDGSLRSTAGMSFAQFVEGYLSDNQPQFARVGRPAKMLTKGPENLNAIDHLFAYDALDTLEEFLSVRLQSPIRFDANVNASPNLEIDLPTALEAKLTDYLADDIALYEAAIR